MGILIEQKASVACIRIDHPPLNVLDLEHLRELRQTLDAVSADRELAAVVAVVGIDRVAVVALLERIPVLDAVSAE